MTLARVFPRKTSMSPTDSHAYFGEPDMFTPHYDIALVSVTFTWDIERGHYLKRAWENNAEQVLLGGPALGSAGSDFTPGEFLKEGVVITSRGCPNNCPWCFVPKREGKIEELPVSSGHIIQDNNLLACSEKHLDLVFKMLSRQKEINFAGGLEASRITDKVVDRLRSLKIYQVWLAYDHPNAEKDLTKAMLKLSRYFKRRQLRCYVLIGYKRDTLEKAESRLVRAWEIGTLPYAMRYRTASLKWESTYLHHSRPWNLLARRWSRMTITMAMMRNSNKDNLCRG